jgi:hypothetical protein
MNNLNSYSYFHGTILKLFLEIDLSLSKPLTNTHSLVIVCLLEDSKAHIPRLGKSLAVNGSNSDMCSKA